MKRAAAAILIIALIALEGCHTTAQTKMPSEQASAAASVKSMAQGCSTGNEKVFRIEPVEGADQTGGVGISNPKEGNAALLAKMDAMPSFMFSENANKMLHFSFGEEPKKVLVRYILGDEEEKPYPYAKGSIVVPSVSGMYFVFVDIVWKDGASSTAYFTIEVMWEDESVSERLKDYREIKSRKAELLPALQEILKDYKSGQVYSYNKNELNFYQFPKGYEFPEISTAEDFTAYSIDNDIGAVSVGVPLGKRGEIIMLFGMNRFWMDGKVKWGATFVIIEAASTRTLRLIANDFMIALQSYVAFSLESSRISVVCQEDYYPENSPELTFLECPFIINGDMNHPIGYLNVIPNERYDEYQKLNIPKEGQGKRIGSYKEQFALTIVIKKENVKQFSGEDEAIAQELVGLLEKLQTGGETIESVYYTNLR